MADHQRRRMAGGARPPRRGPGLLLRRHQGQPVRPAGARRPSQVPADQSRLLRLLRRPAAGARRARYDAVLRVRGLSRPGTDDLHEQPRRPDDAGGRAARRCAARGHLGRDDRHRGDRGGGAAGPDGLPPTQIPAIEGELATINAERNRLVSAIAAGGQLDGLLQALQARETRRATLEAERDRLRAERRLGAVQADRCAMS